MQELLLITPAYTVVGVYRLLTDPVIRQKVWDKIHHGFRRGLIVGAVWAVLSYNVQRLFVRAFLMSTPRMTGLSHDKLFGYPVNVATYATLIFISGQMQTIIRLFLGKNLRLARDRAWEQVLLSRGKSPEFWGSYVEEWQKPPVVGIDPEPRWQKFVTGGLGRFFIRRVILSPLDLYPGIGIIVSAAIKSLTTARYLHRPYFESKKMTKEQVAIFIAEHLNEYRAFGFASALLEGIPFIGLFFTISNRIGACMWAFDLEKRQQRFRAGELKPIAPRVVKASGIADGQADTIELRPRPEGTPGLSSINHADADAPMAGAWKGAD